LGAKNTFALSDGRDQEAYLASCDHGKSQDESWVDGFSAHALRPWLSFAECLDELSEMQQPEAAGKLSEDHQR
jgi:hypothetical protein